MKEERMTFGEHLEELRRRLIYALVGTVVCVALCGIFYKTITREMLTLKRPGSGIAPNELEKIVGRTPADDIPRDTVLCWDMFR